MLMSSKSKKTLMFTIGHTWAGQISCNLYTHTSWGSWGCHESVPPTGMCVQLAGHVMPVSICRLRPEPQGSHDAFTQSQRLHGYGHSDCSAAPERRLIKPDKHPSPQIETRCLHGDMILI